MWIFDILIVAITSNRGLCGAFNNSIVKEANLVASQHNGANVGVLSLGKKAADIFRKGESHYTEGFGEKPYEEFVGRNEIAKEIGMVQILSIPYVGFSKQKSLSEVLSKSESSVIR